VAHRILDELHQSKPFGSPSAEAMVSVLRTAAVLEHALGEALRPLGITHTQYNVLRILRGAGRDGLCGRAVGERLISRVPDVPRLLERLADLELVRRERSGEDRRHVTARITARGRELLQEADRAVRQVEQRRFRELDAGRMAGLIDALEVLRSTR
jgi:DNA-binding MarR family transcriptional regulator